MNMVDTEEKILKMNWVEGGCKLKKTMKVQWKARQENVFVLQKKQKDESCSLISMKQISGWGGSLNGGARCSVHLRTLCNNPDAELLSAVPLSWAGRAGPSCAGSNWRGEHTSGFNEELAPKQRRLISAAHSWELQRLKKMRKVG